MGVKRHGYVIRTYSPIQDCAGPIVFTDGQGCYGHDDEADLVEGRGNRSPTQEDLFWSLPTSVLPMCVWSRLLLEWPLLLPLPPMNSTGAFCMAGVVSWQLR
jgi:hypothetical protein